MKRLLFVLFTLGLLAACTPSSPDPSAGALLQVATVTPLPVVQITSTPLPTQPPQPTSPPPTPVLLQAPPLAISSGNTGSGSATLAGGGNSNQNSAPAVTSPPAPGASIISYSPPANVAQAEQLVIEINNQYRAQAGLAPMIRDETLMAIARTRVQDMIARGYMGHFDPITNVHLGRLLIGNAGYAEGSENWYASSMADIGAFPERAMVWFINDPPHAAGILSTRYSHIGVGLANSGSLWIVVQNFARP